VKNNQALMRKGTSRQGTTDHLQLLGYLILKVPEILSRVAYTISNQLHKVTHDIGNMLTDHNQKEC